MGYPIRVSSIKGVVGDGVTNDAPAIKTALDQAAAVPNGVVLIDGTFYINETINVPEGVTIEGFGRSGEIVLKQYTGHTGKNYSSLGSVIYCGANGGLSVDQRVSLRGLNLIRDFAKTFPDDPVLDENGKEKQPTAIQDTVNANFYGTAIALNQNGYDVTLEDIFVVGFMLAFKTYGSGANERITINRFFADCINGFDLSGISDVSRFRDLHCWAYWTNHRIFSLGGYRSGTAFKLHNRLDACLFSGLFSYGWNVGFDISGVSSADVWAVKLDQCIADNSISIQNTYPCIGFKTTGVVRQVTFTGCHSDSCDINWDLEQDAGHGQVLLVGCSSGQARSRKVKLGAGNGALIGFSSEGPATAELLLTPGVGPWRVDGYSVVNNSSMVAFIDAPGTSPYTDIANVTFGGLTFQNNAVDIDPTQFSSYVDVASSQDQALVGAGFNLTTLAAINQDSLREFSGNLFTAKRAGLYEISYGFGASQKTSSAAQSAFYLGRNGATEIINSRVSLPLTTTTIATGGRTVFIKLKVNDTVGLYSYLDNGGNLYSGRMTMQVRRIAA